MRRVCAALLVLCLLSSACATTGSSEAAKGGTFGALLGAFAAAAAGGSRDDIIKAAAAGAVVGAVTGYVIGVAQERRLADRRAAELRYAYTSSQGPLLRLEQVVVEPSTVAPGGTVQVRLVYTALIPSAADTVTVSYDRELKYGSTSLQEFATGSTTMAYGGGTTEVTFPLQLPSSAAEGTYTMASVVSLPGMSLNQSGAATFYIKNGN